MTPPLKKLILASSLQCCYEAVVRQELICQDLSQQNSPKKFLILLNTAVDVDKIQSYEIFPTKSVKFYHFKAYLIKVINL